IRGDRFVHGGWLRQHSYVVDMLCHRLKLWREPDMRRYFQFVLDAYRGPVWEEQRRRLKALRDAVEAAGGDLEVVTFPFLHALGPNYEYQSVHDELAQLWDEWNVPDLDLLAIYKEIPSKKLVVNRFDAHPNEYAHA